jgi:hypothetical protein
MLFNTAWTMYSIMQEQSWINQNPSINYYYNKEDFLNLASSCVFLFRSPELKAQVSFSNRLLSVVLLSVRLSVNFYIFDFFSRTTGPILTRLCTNDPWAEGLLNCSNEGDCPSSRGDNSKRVKIFWNIQKIFFSRTSCPISMKLDINHPWVKGIISC